MCLDPPAYCDVHIRVAPVERLAAALCPRVTMSVTCKHCLQQSDAGAVEKNNASCSVAFDQRGEVD